MTKPDWTDFALPSSARFPSLVAVLMALAPLTLAAGCGGESKVECTPECPARFHCTESGCVPDSPNPSVDLSISQDLGPSCPPCSGATPYCGPKLQCVPCLEDSHCPAGSICKTAGNSTFCAPGCSDDARCGNGRKCCGGACVDPQSDPQNCGACGTTCKPPHAGASCVAGQCAAGNCSAGWSDCNGDPADGCEVYVRSDTANCTGCGKACAPANAVPGCANGCFIAACKYGFDDCNGAPQDGCETGLLSDVKNCGACAKACSAVARANVACSLGACTIASCTQGYADCNRLFADGCEISLLTDKANCGGCGFACGQNQVCVNGSCTCPPCSFPNARAACVGGQCVIDQCNAGYADCDGTLVNGCELNIFTDAKNCGACGRQCLPGLICSNGGCTCPQCNIPNAKSACVNNVCTLDSCLAGFGDCDKNAANGCEVDLNASASNCGACGNVCGVQKPYCLGGVCAAVAKSCAAIKQANPNSADGSYTIDPDGAGPVAPAAVYCDMTSDGGGWTIVYASAALDGDVGMTSDVAAGGNPLAFGAYNTSRAWKMAISAISQESLFKRKDGPWLKASAALYDASLSTPNSHSHVLVNLTASNGTTAQGAIGYTNVNTIGGGDYGVSVMPDGATCNGVTVNGFDHHTTTYWHLNCGCQRQYLYSYSNNVQDGDQAYNVNTGLGAWTATQNCASIEGGGISFYAAMR